MVVVVVVGFFSCFIPAVAVVIKLPLGPGSPAQSVRRAADDEFEFESPLGPANIQMATAADVSQLAPLDSTAANPST